MTSDTATVCLESPDGVAREEHLAIQELLDLLLSLRTLCERRMTERFTTQVLSLPTIRLRISEELGYRYYYAERSRAEYRDLIVAGRRCAV